MKGIWQCRRLLILPQLSQVFPGNLSCRAPQCSLKLASTKALPAVIMHSPGLQPPAHTLFLADCGWPRDGPHSPESQLQKDDGVTTEEALTVDLRDLPQERGPVSAIEGVPMKDQ